MCICTWLNSQRKALRDQRDPGAGELLRDAWLAWGINQTTSNSSVCSRWEQTAEPAAAAQWSQEWEWEQIIHTALLSGFNTIGEFVSWHKHVYCSGRSNLMLLLFNHLIRMWAREHSRLRVETGLRSVSSRQGSRSIRDTREHTDRGTAIPERLSDSRLVETTRYRVQVINSSITWDRKKGCKDRCLLHALTVETKDIYFLLIYRINLDLE